MKSIYVRFTKRTLFTILIVHLSFFGFAASYYVSNSGNDSNSGLTEALAWKTLAKVNNFKPQPGDQILFKKGDAWEGTLTVTASGASGNPIVYGAYGTGDNPKIYGSTEITGWTKYSGNIYQATVSSDINQLFVDGTRGRLARYPNTGYFNVTSVQSSTQLTSTGLNGSTNYTGATLMGRSSDYTMDARTITTYSSQTLTMSSALTIAVNRGFFLTNKLIFLDQANEWYYDSSTHTVYLWTPSGDSPSNYVVRGSTTNYGISISSKNYITISGLEILHSGNTSIYLDTDTHITVDQCKLTNPEQWGIYTVNNGGSDYLVATSNYVYGANASGIRSYAPYSTISDNDVVDTGLFYNLGKVAGSQNVGTAIFSRAAQSTISYNRIINAGYDGINFWGKNTIVEYNYINGACQVLDDGGGIYTYNVSSSSAGSIVRYNIVLNVFGNRVGTPNNFDAGFGIYMDNESTDIAITNNIIAHTTLGIELHVAGNISVNNNTLFDNITHIDVTSKLSNSTITYNVFYATNRTGDFVGWTNTHQRMVNQDVTAIYNNNKYIDHYRTEDIFGSSYNFSEWKSATGQDGNSKINEGPALKTGETEKLFYNDTKQDKTFDLGSNIYRDIDGISVTGKLTLKPFTGKILIGTKFDATSNDTVNPEITTFSIPATSTSLIVSLSSLSATDNIGVTGYLIAESSTKPLAIAPGWSSTIPTSYTFLSVGSKTLYAWAKDAAGNVSTSLSSGVNISLSVPIPDNSSDLSPEYSTYLFEELSGTNVIDSSSSHDGNIVDTASRVTGKSGKGLSSTGNGYVNLGQVYGEVADGLTLSAWVKPTPSTGYKGVIMHGGPNTDTFALYLNSTSGTIAFKTEGTTSGKWTEIANSTIWDGSWHLLTATYNGSQKIIYLDAVPLITVSATGMMDSGTGYNLLIGAGRDEIPVPLDSQYQGIIDEVRIYNYALNSSQISSLFTTPSTPTANTFSLTGPSSGNLNSPSTSFTVTPNNPFTGTVTITASGTGSAGLSAKVLTFSNSSVAQTFTITPTVAGSITLTATNNSTLSNPANLTYNVNAVVPNAPTSVVANSGNESVSVSFMAPTNTGGSPITGYTVTSNPAGGTDINAGSTLLTHTITGLANGTYTFTVKATNSVGSSVASVASNPIENIIVKQGEIIPSHFTTVWDGLNGLNHMNINVVSANIEDIPLSVNDEIALFSGTACVGTTKLTKSIVPGDNTTFLTILASQNDGSNNGFIDNDTIIFKIWNSKTQKELQVNGVVYRNDISTWKTNGRYLPGSTAVVELSFNELYTQFINLLKGYNMISTNVTPLSSCPIALTKTLADQGNLIKMQDETGNSLENWGDFGGWINQFGALEKTEGYKIQVANNCTLQVTGRRIAMPLDINLKAGWNIISFPRTDIVDAMSIVQTLIDQNKLVKVQDEIGNSIENWGIYGGWKNGIGNFLPGKAYKVKMSTDAVLTFQESYTKSAVIMAKKLGTEYFNSSVEGNGTDHMNINITGLNNIGLSVGDELAAFDGAVCVGTIMITEADLLSGSACLSSSVSTNNQNLNGFKVGNPIQILAWSKLSGDESKVNAEVITGQMKYEKNASVLINMKSATIATAITNLDVVVKIDVFPNPCQGKVTVRFSEIPDENSRIEISDISGRKIISRIISGTSEEFNLNHLTPGLYLVKSILGSSEFVQKLIVNK